MKSQTPKRNRRLRKKLHLGEFRKDYFPVKFSMKATLSTGKQTDLIDRFITMIEDAGLQFGGGGRSDWKGIVEAYEERGSTTDEHRTFVWAWLKAEDDIIECSVGENFDGWYGIPWEAN